MNLGVRFRRVLCTNLSVFIVLILSNLCLGTVTKHHKSHRFKVNTCTSSACKSKASEIINSMDRKVNPCDDFYKFACGNFIKKSIIREEHAVNNSFSRIEDQLAKQLKGVLAKSFLPGDPEVFKKLKDYYDVCTNTAQIEKNSIPEFKQILSELIGGWPITTENSWKFSNFDWMQSSFKLNRKGFSPNIFFHMSVQLAQPDQKRKIFLGSPILGIDKTNLLSHHDPIRIAYTEFMIDAAVAFHVPKSVATQEMIQVLHLESTLAENCPTKAEENLPRHVYELSIGQLQNQFPYIHWLTYINELFTPHKVFTFSDTVILTGEKYFYLLGSVLARTPKHVMANYIGWRMVRSSMFSLNQQVKNAYRKLSKAQKGRGSRYPRWLVCIDYARYRFPLAMGSLYVRRYFDGSKKGRIEYVIRDMRETFTEILQQVDWMDFNTKKEALNKLNKMRAQVAYPKELKDNKKLDKYYRNVAVDPKSLIKTELSLNRFSSDLEKQSILKQVEHYDWTGIIGDSSTANAFYQPSTNAIVFPAAILQPPFFDPKLPKYITFGGIGFIIGHEMTHGFDNNGHKFDENGLTRDWWEPKTKSKFVDKAKCFINQYGGYTEKQVNLKINGEMTLGENIADNGGIKIAYIAYNKWVKRNKEEPRLPGLTSYTPRQLFWISSAHGQCAKYQAEYLKGHIYTDTHSPTSARVILPLSNRPEFAADFSCPKGSPMNPVHKCSVW